MNFVLLAGFGARTRWCEPSPICLLYKLVGVSLRWHSAGAPIGADMPVVICSRRTSTRPRRRPARADNNVLTICGALDGGVGLDLA